MRRFSLAFKDGSPPGQPIAAYQASLPDDLRCAAGSEAGSTSGFLFDVDRITAAVEQANARLSRVEQTKQFAIVPAFWQPGGEEITPTMKVKRHAITARYASLIDSLYAAGQPA